MSYLLPGRTLVVGNKSFLGQKFYEAYLAFYQDVIGTDYKSENPLTRLNLINPDLEVLSLKRGYYKWGLIAAACTNVSYCESEPDQAFKTNVEGTLRLVQGLIERDITPILFSSDYVFDGELGGYVEEAPKRPLNEYGKQKDLLENAVTQITHGNHLILRCSKVVGIKSGDNTLIDQVVKSLAQGQSIQVAFDQFFAPIYEQDMIAAVLKLQNMDAKGLFNLCGPEVWTRLDLTRAIAKIIGADEALIMPISIDDLQIPYQLPKRTYMNCDKFHKITGFENTPLTDLLRRLETVKK
ncbi:MAG: dTDP-4-dehydrorhamnose reductase [archaeon]